MVALQYKQWDEIIIGRVGTFISSALLCFHEILKNHSYCVKCLPTCFESNEISLKCKWTRSNLEMKEPKDSWKLFEPVVKRIGQTMGPKGGIECRLLRFCGRKKSTSWSSGPSKILHIVSVHNFLLLFDLFELRWPKLWMFALSGPPNLTKMIV